MDQNPRGILDSRDNEAAVTEKDLELREARASLAPRKAHRRKGPTDGYTATWTSTGPIPSMTKRYEALSDGKMVFIMLPVMTTWPALSPTPREAS